MIVCPFVLSPASRADLNNLLDRERLPGEPRLIAFGGGAGGTGRSSTICDVARLFVRRGRKVLLVDADLANPNLHLRLGMDPGELDGARWRDDAPLAPLVMDGGRNQPSLLSLGLASPRPFARVEHSAHRLVAALRRLHFDEILIDLPAQTDPLWTTVFVLADVPVLVVPTEAVSLHGATRYIRAALVYALLAHPDAEDARYELVRAIESLDADADADAFAEALAAPALRAILESTLDRLAIYLLLAQTRENAERELGHTLALFWSFLLDVWPRYLGAFDHDDRRWFHQRHDAKRNADATAESTADEVARALLALDRTESAQPRSRRALAREPWQKLGVSPQQDPVKARQAYRRLWEGLRRESPLTNSLIPLGLKERIVRTIEDANRDLQASMAESGAVTAVLPKIERPPSRRPGDAVRDARNALDMSQRELSLQTKIGLRYLEAIERFEVSDLPRPVYLRGYLREIANVLSLDADRFMDEYLTAVSEARSSRILSRSPNNRGRS